MTELFDGIGADAPTTSLAAMTALSLLRLSVSASLLTVAATPAVSRIVIVPSISNCPPSDPQWDGGQTA